jgi:hypothetical protein
MGNGAVGGTVQIPIVLRYVRLFFIVSLCEHQHQHQHCLAIRVLWIASGLDLYFYVVSRISSHQVKPNRPLV